MKLFHNCTILRTMEQRSGFLTRAGYVETGRATITQPCGVPLFTGPTQLTGICRECSEGWTHPGNQFASEVERNRAMASRKDQV